jgi:hypothetical protein
MPEALLNILEANNSEEDSENNAEEESADSRLAGSISIVLYGNEWDSDDDDE